ncbi:hypothetical protein TRICHSKD4_0081 [Roseibium sp. TrichSKD4]|uniref:thermonuclease family protein n=1 Tax=Roseibium sp. TrichSKD4 TaxID=744980 RepID=UPI0001E566B4|nr:hypothetical protein [Roseibium sp. TrichSKD4]EFO34303.1 hypothetical protein TRICHSKD4_0081 [Roseibium sp. TrichSKD4]
MHSIFQKAIVSTAAVLIGLTPGSGFAQSNSEPAPNPSHIRNVSPEGVTPPPVTGPLKRIAPSQRFQEQLNPPAKPIEDGPLVLRRVQVLTANRVASDDLQIDLAYLEPVSAEARCPDTAGGTWPCGARARTFLRGLIRQFHITCEKLTQTGPHEMRAICQRGKMDLTQTMLKHGWGLASVDAPDKMLRLSQEAEKQQLGIWQVKFPRSQAEAITEQTSALQETSGFGLEGEEESLLDLEAMGVENNNGEPLNPFDFPVSEALPSESAPLVDPSNLATKRP